jgi:hypothetical protein
MNYSISNNGRDLIIANLNSSKKYDLFINSLDNKNDTIRFANLEFDKFSTSMISVKNWGNLHKDSIVLKKYTGTEVIQANLIKDSCLNCLKSDVSYSESERNLNIISNPASQFINIEVNDIDKLPLLNEVRIYNVFGQLVIAETTNQESILRINVAKLCPGLYVVNYRNRFGKFVKL